MILAVDVSYSVTGARAAGLLFEDWTSDQAVEVLSATLDNLEEYVPGQFYLRELPALMTVIQPVLSKVQTIMIDGYVSLGAEGRPGLGMHLWHALGGAVPIIGVAKTRFHGTPEECEVFRGQSRNPLFVTSVGLPLEEAKAHIRDMAGPHRIPTLLKEVDRLSRSG
ncbi:endonuclease V [Deinococcus sp. YIM 134068]|uniref:endonuclease V n=1 Tax=Deinococcus lichenicola TaxID=3118910 RepID=UPI002F9466C6